MFYNWYANVKDFSARKGKVMKNISGQVTRQIFLCHRKGKKRGNQGNNSTRKRKPKPNFCCGCEASFAILVEENSGWWYTKYFNDVHNHKTMEDKFIGMLLSHRRTSEDNRNQMSNIRTVCIMTPHIYSFFASQAGGFDKVGFPK